MDRASHSEVLNLQQHCSENPTSCNMKCCLVRMTVYFQHVYNIACDTVAPSTRSHLSSHVILTQPTLLLLVSNIALPALYTYPGSSYWRPGHVFLLTPDTSRAQPLAATAGTRITCWPTQADTRKPALTLGGLVDTLKFSANSSAASTSVATGAMNTN